MRRMFLLVPQGQGPAHPTCPFRPAPPGTAGAVALFGATGEVPSPGPDHVRISLSIL